ncbi:GntR family transcriptional regulator [Vitreoscilla filiformis]|jgi:DNA-binding GntR family transcriptional regulator|uniref:GntR family transcriptional regulator n=1 Tax=Vitreoscilla filiformis TaxID=63 RepID=A0A221KE95_VITFI|nr:GntR family transcriptional regulator [Vitreoscilla filiformis]ASM77157.1 GntR family transcriptional regulator [Vitreoscilla filiformis]
MNTLAATESTSPRTQVERAYLALRQDIVQGDLPPGEKLRVEHLKDRYEVGAGTLREALSLLVSDALVTAEGQRGFRVATASLADLEDVTRLRVMLETEALRQSIRLGTAAWAHDLTRAYEALATVERHHPRPYPPEWETLNQHFHAALIAADPSNWTRHFLDILYRHAARYRYVALRLAHVPHPPRDVSAEHEALYHAAVQRREARAALVLEDHVRATLDVLRTSGHFTP